MGTATIKRRAKHKATVSNNLLSLIENDSKKPLTEKELCMLDAQNYMSRSEWQRSNSAMYLKAYLKREEGWLKEATKHMVQLRKPKSHWTKEKVLEDAKKFTNRTEWNHKSFSAYSLAKHMDIFEQATKHMVRSRG